MKKYKTLVIDPPWNSKRTGLSKTRGFKSSLSEYSLMTDEEIKKLPINELADDGCHLWLWCINQYLPLAFELIKLWNFKYLMPIVVIKPSGVGNWFVSRTTFILFAYKNKCVFNRERWKWNILFVPNPRKHSEKHESTFKFIESISDEPRLELFSRNRRENWDCWGNEIQSDININDWRIDV